MVDEIKTYIIYYHVVSMAAVFLGPISPMVYKLITEISQKFYALNLTIMIQSDHKFAHAMAAQLSWHVQK